MGKLRNASSDVQSRDFDQYDQWKEKFPVEQISQEQVALFQLRCLVKASLLSQDRSNGELLEPSCMDDPESGQSIRTCSGYISGLWTNIIGIGLVYVVR